MASFGMSDRFLKLSEVQRQFGVSRSTVWRWHAERGLRVVRVGGVTRIRESDLEDFLNRHVCAANLGVIAGEKRRAETMTKLQVES